MNKFQNELNTLRQRQQILAILVFALVAISTWVGVSLLSSQRQTRLSSELLELAKPLNPSINTTVIEQISQKRQYTADELDDFPIFTTAKVERVQRTVAPSPIASTSAAAQLISVEPTVEASQSSETVDETAPEGEQQTTENL